MVNETNTSVNADASLYHFRLGSRFALHGSLQQHTQTNIQQKQRHIGKHANRQATTRPRPEDLNQKGHKLPTPTPKPQTLTKLRGLGGV